MDPSFRKALNGLVDVVLVVKFNFKWGLSSRILLCTKPFAKKKHLSFTFLKGATVTVSEAMNSTSGCVSHFDFPLLRNAVMICLEAVWSSGRVTRKSMSTSTCSLLWLLAIITFSAGPFLVMVTRSDSSPWLWSLLDSSSPSAQKCNIIFKHLKQRNLL